LPGKCSVAENFPKKVRCCLIEHVCQAVNMEVLWAALTNGTALNLTFVTSSLAHKDRPGLTHQQIHSNDSDFVIT